MDIKELLGEELATQVSEALKGKGRDGKDLEFVITNSGDYVPANKYDNLKKESQKYKTDYETLNSKYETDINEAKSNSEKLLKKSLLEFQLDKNNITKVNGNYDVYFNGNIIDLDKVTINNGVVEGIDVVVNDFMTANPNLVVKKSTEVEKTNNQEEKNEIPAAQGINPPNAQSNIKDLAYYTAAYKNANDLVQKCAIKREAAEQGINI